jgi:pimeloyl-ACP methyl ester carboxylesterase
MRGEFVDLNGVRLYCYAFGQRGAGHPIVLVHGSFTSSHLWQDVLPRLPKGHRVLVLDLLGHGRSDPPGAESMTVAAHADRLAQLLDVMGVREVMLVGHGMGAAVAARVAHEHPDRIAHLMLVNPTLLAGRASEAMLNRRVRRVAALVPLWRRLAPSWLASALHAALLPCFAHRDAGARSLDVYLKPFRLRDGRDAACAQLSAGACCRGSAVPHRTGTRRRRSVSQRKPRQSCEGMAAAGHERRAHGSHTPRCGPRGPGRSARSTGHSGSGAADKVRLLQ